MECPKCNNELELGNLKLRASHQARVIYSPIDIEDKFIEKWLPGSIFDNKLQHGEFEILKATMGKANKVARKSYYCKRCKMIVILEDE
ncbi:MAG TPA: PF20097 family protein [Bacillota bacterium]|nr:PF20097 family protein [Bacillota bacterium]